MGDFFKLLGAMIVVGVMLLAFAVASQLAGFKVFAYFAPLYEQVRYSTFQQSQAYNEGMLRDLYDLQREYLQADDEHRAALSGVIRHRFSAYDRNRLPLDLRQFYAEVNQ
jgi:hypothetical protein